MNRDVIISTGAFIGRVNDRNRMMFINSAPSLCGRRFEFMVYNSWGDSTGDYIRDFLMPGFEYPVLHADKNIGELVSLSKDNIPEAVELFGKKCKYASALGAEKIVLHLWNGPESDRNFGNHLSALPYFIDVAEGAGLLLTVENVVCAAETPLSRMAELHSYFPDLKFTFDTKMAAFHGEMGKICSDEYRHFWEDGIISHIHCNDFGGTAGDFSTLRTLHIGQGNIDFISFFRFLRSVGYSGSMTLECTCMRPDGSVDPEAMNRDVAEVGRLMELAGL